uniref:Uncharacterized protein n=2 Tax=viral metagenome TaxID=1070528 RepID=A0A6M3XN40_9ZZZZ
MTNTWTTAKGSKIELTTEHITTETIDVDGHKATVKADRIEITECKVNGQSVPAKLTRYENKNVLHYGTQKINGVTHPLLVLIPDNTYEAAWGDYNRRIVAEAQAEAAAEMKYQEHHNKILKAMEE